jgi:hypothetical protein
MYKLIVITYILVYTISCIYNSIPFTRICIGMANTKHLEAMNDLYYRKSLHGINVPGALRGAVEPHTF